MIDGEGSLESDADRLEVLDRTVLWAREAGALLAARFGRLGQSDVTSKSTRRDLVTRTDVEVEELLVRRIRSAHPTHAIRAEERTHEDGALVWHVDPLDGTVNFVHGLPFFCVSIALFRGTQPLVAVVHAPMLGETFTAAAGCGARVLDERGADGADGRVLRVSTATDLMDALVGTGFPYRRNELPNGNLGNFARVFPHVRGVRRMGSAALDLAFCAAGRLDAFWELHLEPHDVAAGALLVREAGGLVTDLDGGDDWLARGDLVAGPAALVAALRRHVHTGAERPPLGPPFAAPDDSTGGTDAAVATWEPN
ncbi:Inositol-1-monophosphatase [Planctomycetes bacterium Pla163]|uniref:Inositol-1-monophosphatase n=1 Tax=Rohdeia mirabilis TaxID=2528008 RepID=A0A518D0G3_9BACT|nr:Inositol-1-monophosphatase [Planctomycetes bacterium Pla163]